MAGGIRDLAESRVVKAATSLYSTSTRSRTRARARANYARILSSPCIRRVEFATFRGVRNVHALRRMPPLHYLTPEAGFSSSIRIYSILINGQRCRKRACRRSRSRAPRCLINFINSLARHVSVSLFVSPRAHLREPAKSVRVLLTIAFCRPTADEVSFRMTRG